MLDDFYDERGWDVKTGIPTNDPEDLLTGEGKEGGV
jgi:hypothetical protein